MSLLAEDRGGVLHLTLNRPEAMNALTSGMRSDGLTFIKAVRKLGKRSAHVSAELPRKHWPMMVRFGDIHDPKSVEKVEPEAIGVKRITLETTSDPVTAGIEKRLGWLKTLEASQSESVVETSSTKLVGQLRNF